jgi:hypothetical protein
MAFGIPIASVEVTSANQLATLNLANISQEYTDLYIIANFKTTATADWFTFIVNYDGSNTYERNGWYKGNATTPIGMSNASVPRIYGERIADGSTDHNANEFSTVIIEIPNYSNTSMYKQLYFRGGKVGTNPASSTGFIWNATGLYASTNGISNIQIICDGASPISIGSTIDIYGTKRLGL